MRGNQISNYLYRIIYKSFKNIMKKVFQLKTLAMLAVAVLVSGIAFAQNMPAKKAPASPRDSVSGVVGKATISINYGAPSLRGRKILGTIEPYGKPWRAGANQSTTFTTDKDIMVEGQKLAAGKYSLFAIPTETEWKIIFNSQTGQWGVKKDTNDSRGYSANDDPSKDVLVVTVKPKKAGPTERLTYTINKKGFALVWEDVEVPVKIK
jgi:hypothetical protein